MIRPRLNSSLRLFALFLMAFVANKTALANQLTSNSSYYTALTPEQKDFLENALEQSTLPSYCPQTAFYSQRARGDSLATAGLKADYVLVDKKRRWVHLLNQGQVLKSYRMALGGAPLGDKNHEGDGKTPEGLYFIDLKNTRSDFHLSLRINYPNRKDLKEAALRGIQDPGKDIMLHGLPNSWLRRKFIKHPQDWTRGCIAVNNPEIQQIFERVELGTLIEICP